MFANTIVSPSAHSRFVQIQIDEKAKKEVLSREERLRRDLDRRKAQLNRQMDRNSHLAMLIETHHEFVESGIHAIQSEIASGIDWNDLRRALEEERKRVSRLQCPYKFHARAPTLTILMPMA